jgi:UDP-3-O-[3-hydroxymyristoyl] glucosamine N-acyltransferase
VADAYLAFSKLEFYDQARGNKSGIEQPSVISENTKYGNLYLGSFSYVGNVLIGDNVKIYPMFYWG